MNIVLGKNYSQSVTNSLLVSCEDEDQPELPPCPPLLASLSPSYTSDCPTTEPNGQPSYDECTKLYSMLEAALLKNQVNLFKLHSNFFPHCSSEPTYVMVSYTVNGEQCYNNSRKCYDTCWTSSTLLESADLSVLVSLQLQLLNVIGAVAVDGFESLFIELRANFTESDYHYATINAVLQDLTLLVSAKLD